MSTDTAPTPLTSRAKLGEVRREQSQLLLERYSLQRQAEPIAHRLAEVEVRLRDITSVLEGAALGDHAATETAG